MQLLIFPMFSCMMIFPVALPKPGLELLTDAIFSVNSRKQ